MLKGDEEALKSGRETFKGNGQGVKVNLKALIGDVEALMGNRKAIKSNGEMLTLSLLVVFPTYPSLHHLGRCGDGPYT